jgi:hypothetical protein
MKTIKKTVNKVRGKFMYYFMYIALRRSGVHKEHAKIMANEFIYFKYLSRDDD